VPEQWQYHITTADEERALKEARRRCDHKTRRSVPSNKVDTEASELEVHVRGVYGEIAFANLFEVGLDTKARINGDGGIDFQFTSGLTIDVKTRSQPGRDLALFSPTLPGRSAHVFVLCWRITRRTYQLAGWTTPVGFLFDGRVERFPQMGERLLAQPQDLMPLSALKQLRTEWHSSLD
jgi:hypothetical protein